MSLDCGRKPEYQGGNQTGEGLAGCSDGEKRLLFKNCSFKGFGQKG
uniref:Uncharacterized protein n=1 Tax=Anguilla anguilla TaxID=7936 RepID=A0A0E9UP53_ANGAN